jgi:hypothetical protein
MPFDDIKAWFLRDEILVQEVVPGLIPRASSTILNELATLLAGDSSLRSGLGLTAISADVAREMDASVVIWPDQSAANALTVARTRSPSLYDVVGTQLHEGSENYRSARTGAIGGTGRLSCTRATC